VINAFWASSTFAFRVWSSPNCSTIESFSISASYQPFRKHNSLSPGRFAPISQLPDQRFQRGVLRSLPLARQHDFFLLLENACWPAVPQPYDLNGE
jgi:hypothetical protein